MSSVAIEPLEGRQLLAAASIQFILNDPDGLFAAHPREELDALKRTIWLAQATKENGREDDAAGRGHPRPWRFSRNRGGSITDGR